MTARIHSAVVLCCTIMVAGIAQVVPQPMDAYERVSWGWSFSEAAATLSLTPEPRRTSPRVSKDGSCFYVGRTEAAFGQELFVRYGFSRTDSSLIRIEMTFLESAVLRERGLADDVKAVQRKVYARFGKPDSVRTGDGYEQRVWHLGPSRIVSVSSLGDSHVLAVALTPRRR